ncbi:hypothetical protein U737_12755 [Methylomonas sp. LW13]|uniref:MAPEG family protein n=2 Tax=Methylomonas TaxID=416 RepID=UPI00051B75A6|nr:MAPEG family protein [Methylomonas sp. Kb3]PKD40588.1 hypothetical protein CWO84_08920 [Methylomonas sp. Kb3]QBC27704.1 hypothetical protein U737_12755 [Methylomonas sp. LW13]
MSPINSTATNISLPRIYTAPCIIVGSVAAWLFWLLAGEHRAVPPELLVSPMATLFTLTALVWLTMVVARNVAVIRGHASIRYFADYKADVPADDRFERPARTFNNLMQVPALFYVICLLMLVEKEVDTVQIALAWAFVVLRYVHAVIYMAVNWVPYRFATWASSCIILGVLWFRFVTAVGLG